jgi:hypothetical protein
MPRTADGRYYPSQGWAIYKTLVLADVPDEAKADAARILDRCEALEANVSNLHHRWCYWNGIKHLPPNWLKMDARYWASFKLYVESDTAAEMARLVPKGVTP